MAVRVLPRWRARAPLQVVSVPPGVLVLTLVAPALDLLMSVQPAAALPGAGMLASGVAATALLLMWVQFPRNSWLFAASLAAVASLAMRLMGADVAPFLSLLSILALGVGGAFATSDVSLTAV